MEYLSLEEAAAMMGVSVTATRGLIERGKLPWSKVCGRVRIEARQLEEFCLLCRVRTAEEAVAAQRRPVGDLNWLDKEKRVLPYEGSK